MTPFQYKNIAAHYRSMRAELGASEQARAALGDELAAAVRERVELAEQLAHSRDGASREFQAQMRTATLRIDQLRRDLNAALEAVATERATRTALTDEQADLTERVRTMQLQVRQNYRGCST